MPVIKKPQNSKLLIKLQSKRACAIDTNGQVICTETSCNSNGVCM